MKNFEYMEKITFRELASKLGIKNLMSPEIYDIEEEGYEILSFDHNTNSQVWKSLEAFVVKPGVDKHYKLNNLHGTANHKVFFNEEYIELQNHPHAVLVNSPIEVVDCQVADTKNYIAEGEINHNTTTPGGMAIPYACSVRLEMMTAQQIKIKLDNKEEKTIGVIAKVKTVKNKVAPPFRACEFNIIFGKGINDDEQVFDVLRAHCDIHKFIKIENNKKATMEGAGAWKTFSVLNDITGEVLHSIKFYKPEFRDKVLSNPELDEYVNQMLDVVMISTDIPVETMNQLNEAISGEV